MDEDRRIAAVADVPTDGTLLVTLRNDDGETEAILTRLADGVVAFRNSCPHWTNVRLDRGSGALVRGDELVCRKHGATFEQATGYCDFGPCEGAMLDTVDVTTDDGAVYLADDDYTFERLGGTGDGDLSSGSRIDF
jgi:nitrite reductase/ring-hydroxylating ferredoxin subunit